MLIVNGVVAHEAITLARIRLLMDYNEGKDVWLCVNCNKVQTKCNFCSLCGSKHVYELKVILRCFK